MIDAVDSLVVEWMRAIAKRIDVTLLQPGSAPEREGICVCLLDVHDSPALRNHALPPLQVRLRYLVFAHAADAAREHKMLGDLMLAALDPESPDRPEMDVEFDPPSPELWRALALPPRPSFWLRVPLRKERPRRPGTMVTKPLVLQGEPLVDLEGVVLGPGDVPIAGAEVEIGGLDRWTRTDGAGRFVLRSISALPRNRSFVVRAKGRELAVVADASSAEPLVIRLALQEP